MIVLVTALPVGLLGIASALATEEAGSDAQALAEALLQLVPLVLVYPISWVAGTIATLAILHGERPTVSGAFEPVGARFWPMAAVLAVYTVGVVGGFIAFIAPGVYLLVVWLFAPQAAVIEGLGTTASLTRSSHLVRGGWWQAFGTFIVLELLTGIVILGALLALRVAVEDLSESTQIVVAGVLSVALTVLVKPFQIIGIALLYLDRRVRLEGVWPPVPVAPPARR